jgi:hypothetical protein
MKRFSLILALAAVALLAFPTAAFAAGLPDGKVVVGGTYTLRADEVLTGDLMVIGGVATLEPGSRVTGTVALIGGVLEAAGTIDGDVAAIGGSANLGATAVVHGDVITLGSAVGRAEGAIVEGQFSAGDVDGPLNLTIPQFNLPEIRQWERGFSPLRWTLGIGWYFLRAFLYAALAAIVVMFWPLRTGRAAQAAVAQPLLAGGLGLITFLVAIPVIVLLVLTICLSPLAFLAGIVLVVAYVFGWIAIGLELGQRMAAAFRQDWSLATSAGLGTLTLTLVLYAINSIPCVGFIAPAAAYCLGLGAVMLTRFGGQDYLGTASGTAMSVPS